MIALCASHSDFLVSLIQSRQVDVDRVEVGPWMSLEAIRRSQAELPGMQFLYHAGNPASAAQLFAGTVIATHSPWASIHINLLLPGALRLALRFGLGLPHASPEWHTRRFIQKARRLAHGLPVPVLLENMPGMRHLGYGYESEPGRIAQILENTGYNLLLDIAHARQAAWDQDMPVTAYLDRLPLERVVEIHVSGPRRQNGRLVDAHEPMELEDYALLRWVLRRCRPQVVTLEYYRASKPLEQQLGRLRDILG